MRDLAMKSWTNCFSASGPPNASRSCARRHISSNARSAEPIARMQWWMRPGPSRSCAIAKPRAALAEQVVGRHAAVLVADLPVAGALVVAHHRHRAHAGRSRACRSGTRIMLARLCGGASGSVTTIAIASAAPL